MSLCQLSSALSVVMLLCAGCAATSNVTSPLESSAPVLPLPPATRVLGRATLYVSAAGEKLEIVHDSSAGVAILRLPDGGMAVLSAEIAGSDGRYRDSRMTLWENGGGVSLWIDGKLVFSGKGAN